MNKGTVTPFLSASDLKLPEVATLDEISACQLLLPLTLEEIKRAIMGNPQDFCYACSYLPNKAYEKILPVLLDELSRFDSKLEALQHVNSLLGLLGSSIPRSQWCFDVIVELLKGTINEIREAAPEDSLNKKSEEARAIRRAERYLKNLDKLGLYRTSGL